MSRGTPKTLNQAVQHAFLEFKKEGGGSEARLRKHIMNTVRDFMRNKLGPVYLLAGSDEAMNRAVKEIVKSL